MGGRLVVIDREPVPALAALRAVWNAGDAALLLPPAAADVPVRRERLLASLAPTHRWAEGGVPEPLAGGRGVPGSIALVVATSGSTGEPKGVALSHAALDAATTASVDRLGARPGDRFALALPVHHIAGVQVALRAWRCGTEPVVVDDWRRLADLGGDGWHVSLVPTQLAGLLTAGSPPIGWRSVLVGGAALDPATAAAARGAGVRLVTSYGMTETAGGCVYDGRPFEDVEVAVTDDGRIRLRGPVLCDGVRRADGSIDAVTDPDGWFTTRDLGRLEAGPSGPRLVVLGRADEVIVTGGVNVAGPAVAAALRSHPGVADAAVVGRPDPTWGQRVTAVIVPTDPTAPPDLDDLRRTVASTLPRNHAPREVVVVSAVPRTALGKVDRAAVDGLVAGETGGPVPGGPVSAGELDDHQRIGRRRR